MEQAPAFRVAWIEGSDWLRQPSHPFGAKRNCATKVVHDGSYLKDLPAASVQFAIFELHALAMRMIGERADYGFDQTHHT